MYAEFLVKNQVFVGTELSLFNFINCTYVKRVARSIRNRACPASSFEVVSHISNTAANFKTMGEQLKLRGVLSGHGNWVTAIATTQEDPTLVLTASRDKVSFCFFKIKMCHCEQSLPSLYPFIYVDHHRVDPCPRGGQLRLCSPCLEGPQPLRL